MCLPAFGVECQCQIAMNCTLLDSYVHSPALPKLSEFSYNDIWGYSNAGREYAIVGTVDSIIFFDVTNPTNIKHVDGIGFSQGSLWRDMKTYGDYCFAVADQSSFTYGLTTIDLSFLPDSVHLVSHDNSDFNRAHNIFIEESEARLYVVGSPSNNLFIYDISDPENIVKEGGFSLSRGYVHDIFVINDTAYASHGNRGLAIYDCSAGSSCALINYINSYPEKGYNHSSWRSDDGKQLVFTDETEGKGVKIMDVSDPYSLFVSPSNVFRSALLAPAYTNSLAHNPFIIGDYVYISYYLDGVQIFDISNPNSVKKSRLL